MFALLDEDDPIIEICEDASGIAAVAPLAFCAETNRLASIETRLDLMAGRQVSGAMMELTYKVNILDLRRRDQSFTTQDRAIVARELPRTCRLPILTTVMRSCSLLVKAATPDRLYRVAPAADLPEKALRKHTRMTKHLIELGYETVEYSEDPTGRSFWLAARTDAEDTSMRSMGAKRYVSSNVFPGTLPIANVVGRLSVLRTALNKQATRHGRRKAA